MTKEEAIKIIRENMHLSYDEGNIFEALKTLVPELNEREDERIRKEIIGYLTHRADVTAFVDETKDCERWIAYLEKQKEQKPKFNAGDTIRLKNSYAEYTIESISGGRYYCKGCSIDIDGGNRDYELVQQKPAEYEKPLLSKFEQAVYDCAWGKVTCKPEGETQEEYAKRWAEHLFLMVRNWADDYIDSQIELAKRKAYDKGKSDAEKLVEWSEEDEKIANEILDHLNTGNAEWFNWFNARFKSLRPQPTQEWNEEDEKMRDAAIDFVKQNKSFDFILGIDKDFVIDWLKSLRPSFER